MKNLLLIFILVSVSTIYSQSNLQLSDYGTLHRFELTNAPFPDTERDSGHVYRDKHYPKDFHYNDSTTLVFVPDYLELKNNVDIVVYFHGWNNNVDTVLAKFNLIEQFHTSGKKAILVIPEGPKNAPDSFGGKLEEAGRFQLFIVDVIDKLKEVTNQSFSHKNILLAGHSGAYRVMAYILLHGGLTENISEVFLFDGLYADVEKYSYWLDHYTGRFINIYTSNGGTKRESGNFMQCLNAWGISYTFIEGDKFTNEQLQDDRIIFISSQLEHNEVISSQNQFRKFLETSLVR